MKAANIRWSGYKPRTITERHVSNTPSSDTSISEVTYLLEEFIPGDSKSVLLICPTVLHARKLVRFFSVHLVRGTVTVALQGQTDFRKEDLSAARRAKVRPIVANVNALPFRPKSVEHVVFVDLERKAQGFSRFDDISELYSKSMVAALGGRIGIQKAILRLNSPRHIVSGICGSSWSVIRITCAPRPRRR